MVASKLHSYDSSGSCKIIFNYRCTITCKRVVLV